MPWRCLPGLFWFCALIIYHIRFALVRLSQLVACPLVVLVKVGGVAFQNLPFTYLSLRHRYHILKLISSVGLRQSSTSVSISTIAAE